MRLESDAPINLHWGRDNRTCGLRIPDSGPEARRVENRIGGADSNPYIALAATLACGLMGLDEGKQPGPVTEGDAHELSFSLPRHLPEALGKLDECQPLRDVLGSRFIDAFVEVKNLELAKYNQVVSSWERNFLLLSI
jgi:glutamine synthetase